MTRDYREASKAAAASDFAKAVSLLKNLVEDGKDRPVQAKARLLLADLEKQAAARFLRAKTLVEVGRSDEGREAILEVVRLFPGTPAASDADRYLARLASQGSAGPEREKQARDALAQAREDYRTQQFAACLDRCETIATLYPELPEALQATQLAGTIKDNPEWLKQAVEQQGDRLAQLYLAMAETWLRKGQPQQAIFYLERVQQLFPNSRHAEAAGVRLAQVQGLPMKK
jgi:predicted Zn-dependent protease